MIAQTSALFLQAASQPAPEASLTMVSAAMAFMAVAAMVTAMRRAAAFVAAFVTAMAAMGSVVILVVIFFGLFAVSLLVDLQP